MTLNSSSLIQRLQELRMDVDPVLPLVCPRPLPEVAAEQAP
jgi:hypothetical protein